MMSNKAMFYSYLLLCVGYGLDHISGSFTAFLFIVLFLAEKESV